MESNNGQTLNAEQVALLQQQVNLLQSDFVANAFTLRRDLMTQFFDPRRNLYHECGYPEPRKVISAWDYQDLYDREPIAARVVGLMPQECWQSQPSIYEDEDPEVITSFEEGWDNLGTGIRGEHSHYREEEGSTLWEYFRRVDELSRIGHYGILLIGLDDGLDLMEPAKGIEELNSFPVEKEMEEEEVDSPLYEGQKSKQRVPKKGGNGPTVNYLRGKPEIVVNGRKRIPQYRLTSNFLPSLYQGTSGADYTETEGNGKKSKDGEPTKGKGNKLKYLRVFGESQAQITSWESNPSSPRYGQPTSYLVSFNDPRDDLGGIGYPLSTRNVHWSRVLHVADTHHQACSSEVIAVPALRPVLNPVLDIQKMRGGSAEGYWKMGIPGLTWESHPNLGTFKIDATKAREQVEEWWNGMQRLLLSMGGSFKTLAPSITDPTPFIDLQVNHVCVQIGVPLRIFLGSERGELASSQDERAHRNRVKQRRHNYITPRILVPFIDRMILLGCLPAPAKKGSKLNVKEEPLKPEEIIQGEEGDEEQLPKEEELTLEPEEGEEEEPKELQGIPPERLRERVGNAFPPQFKGKPSSEEGAEDDSEFPFKPTMKAGVPSSAGPNGKPLTDGQPTKFGTPSSIQEEGAGMGEEGMEDIYEAPGGYCIEWPDDSAASDAEQADVCAKNTTSLTAYIQGQGQSLVPEVNYLTHPLFMNMDEEEARQMLEEAARVEEEELAEQQLQAEEFGFQPEAPEGMIDPDQADREMELAEGKLEVDKERAKAGLPGGGGPPQLQGGKPGMGPEFTGKPKPKKPTPFGR